MQEGKTPFGNLKEEDIIAAAAQAREWDRVKRAAHKTMMCKVDEKEWARRLGEFKEWEERGYEIERIINWALNAIAWLIPFPFRLYAFACVVGLPTFSGPVLKFVEENADLLRPLYRAFHDNPWAELEEE